MGTGLEAVREELRREAAANVSELEKQGDAEAEGILSAARSQAKEILSASGKEAEGMAAEEGMRVSGAKLRAGKIVSQAREQQIAAVLSLLLERLSESSLPRNAAKSGYEKLFAKLAKQGLKEVEGGVIRCRKQDIALARKLGRVGEPIECSGGLVIESPDGRVRLDATFDGLLEQHKDELSGKAYGLLFEK